MPISKTTQSLLDEFRARPTLRAGSLIVTVFGDAIAPRGGTVWIGSLIKALRDFGVSERLVRTSVYRLIQDNWLSVDQVGRRSYYSLSDEGARRFGQATVRIYGEPLESWSGDWCLVLLSGLEAEQKERARKEIGWLGFAAISSSVLAHPSPDIAALELLLEQTGLSRQLIVMQGQTLGKNRDETMRELVHKSWNLAEIDLRYQAFIGQFRSIYAGLRKAKKPDNYNAFLVRILMIQEYRKILLRDPLLPSELLPADWSGITAYRLCRNIYRLVCDAADEYISEEFETADGRLPLPSASFSNDLADCDEEHDMKDLLMAKKCAAAMMTKDIASKEMGIRVTVDEAGCASAVLNVEERMLNGHGVCHGGFIFALADTTFAVACNAYNQVTLAAVASIDFLRPAKKGDRLMAEARERFRGGRSGIYEVTVTNQHGEEIALFKGRSHATRENILP